MRRIAICVFIITVAAVAVPAAPADAILGIPCPIAKAPSLYEAKLVEGNAIVCPHRDKIAVLLRTPHGHRVLKVCRYSGVKKVHAQRCLSGVRCRHGRFYGSRLVWWYAGDADWARSAWRKLC